METPTLSPYLNLFSKTSTFVSIDIVGSTALKAGENEQDILYTFLAYHKLVSELSYADHGEVLNITGDGMMCRFERPADAARLAKNFLDALPGFNKRQNHLSRPLAARIGVHTGKVLESEQLASGQIISQTIDLAAKLQQRAATNSANFSEATRALLATPDFTLEKAGWDATLQMNIYRLAQGAALARESRQLPSPVRALVVDQELDEVMKVKKTLWARQHEALPVYTHQQAALCLPAFKPHLLLLSADLPWEGGWELLQTLRSDPQFSKMPILMMSSQPTGQVIEKAFAKGANGFLRKPLDETQLVKRVEMALREFYL